MVVNRNRVLVLLVALVCIGALAIAAATVDAPRQSDPGSGTGTGTGIGSGSGQQPEEPSQYDSGRGFPPIFQYLAIVIFALAMLYVLYSLVRSLGMRELGQLLAIVAVLAIVGALAYILIGLPDGTQPQQPPQMTPSNDSGGSGTLGRTQQHQPKSSNDVPVELLAAFGLLALLLVGAIVRFSGSEPDLPDPTAAGETSAEEDADVEAVGKAAGRAADELAEEGGDVENAVYRAWREMTDALSVRSPETTTPAEFADAAVDAGMDADDVRELTWLFEEVRYGDARVTDDRERRAERALRRIEDAYGSEDDDE